MLCNKCGKELRSSWIEIKPGTKRLVVRCGCLRGGIKGKEAAAYHKQQPAAYFKDEKTGTMIPVDAKGQVVDNDPYYQKGDPRGWKRAGKYAGGYERQIHLDEGGNELK